eukprot:SAG22_NODE_202_length_15324_cov_7.802627_11_plen_445_part_00
MSRAGSGRARGRGDGGRSGRRGGSGGGADAARSASMLPPPERATTLLVSLRSHLGPAFEAAGAEGFNRPTGIAALRALIGISTSNAVLRDPVNNYHGDWPEPQRVQVAAALMGVGRASEPNKQMLREVLTANGEARSLDWLGVLREALASGFPAVGPADPAQQAGPALRGAQAALGPQPQPGAGPAEADIVAGGFSPAPAFDGFRPNCVYRNGSSGLGYYHDQQAPGDLPPVAGSGGGAAASGAVPPLNLSACQPRCVIKHDRAALVRHFRSDAFESLAALTGRPATAPTATATSPCSEEARLRRLLLSQLPSVPASDPALAERRQSAFCDRLAELLAEHADLPLVRSGHRLHQWLDALSDDPEPERKPWPSIESRHDDSAASGCRAATRQDGTSSGLRLRRPRRRRRTGARRLPTKTQAAAPRLTTGRPDSAMTKVGKASPSP